MLCVKHSSRSLMLRSSTNINSSHCPCSTSFSNNHFQIQRCDPSDLLHTKGHYFLFSLSSKCRSCSGRATRGLVCQGICFQDSSSAVLLFALNGSGGQGLGWWLGRSALSLVVHGEKINHGLSVVLGRIPGQAETAVPLRQTQLSFC